MSIKTPNWRDIISENNKKCRLLISLYFAIYTFIGFWLDLFVFYFFVFYESKAAHTITSSTGYIKAFLIFLRSYFNSILSSTYTPIVLTLTIVIAIINIAWAYKRLTHIVLKGKNSRLLTRNTCKSDKDKVVLNVLDEMLIAMSIKHPPRVFITDEDYLNAFSSGVSETDSIIVLTRPLVSQLDRSELQAVIAHELSHIKYNDTKLFTVAHVLTNLIAILTLDFSSNSDHSKFKSNKSGSSSSSRSNSSGGGGGAVLIILLVVYFLIVFITPYLVKHLFSRLTKSSDDRADAGSVGATRDNVSLATALMKIHISHISDARIKHHYARSKINRVISDSFLYAYNKNFSVHYFTSLIKTRLNQIEYKMSKEQINSINKEISNRMESLKEAKIKKKDTLSKKGFNYQSASNV